MRLFTVRGRKYMMFYGWFDRRSGEDRIQDMVIMLIFGDGLWGVVVVVVVVGGGVDEAKKGLAAPVTARSRRRGTGRAGVRQRGKGKTRQKVKPPLGRQQTRHLQGPRLPLVPAIRLVQQEHERVRSASAGLGCRLLDRL